jgi:ABC-type multidrug transport system permease subunit
VEEVWALGNWSFLLPKQSQQQLQQQKQQQSLEDIEKRRRNKKLQRAKQNTELPLTGIITSILCVCFFCFVFFNGFFFRKLKTLEKFVIFLGIFSSFLK